MSRAQLLTAARKLGIATEFRQSGKRGVKDNNWLRLDIMERCYGPGLHWPWPSAAVADAACLRAAGTARDELGYGLSMSQYIMKQGNVELAEYRRLRDLKKRRPEDEAARLRSARQWFEMARIAMELHELETASEQRN